VLNVCGLVDVVGFVEDVPEVDSFV
jgi:hypothetical protein